MNTTPPPEKRGAPTVRTAKNARRILKAVSAGCPLAHAAKAAGVSYSTLCDWRNSDPQFREQLEEAISVAVEKRLQIIRDAADAGDWRASAEWLRLVLPGEFGRNRVEITGADGTPLAAGVQLYLPAKQAPAVASDREPLALPERNGIHANGD